MNESWYKSTVQYGGTAEIRYDVVEGAVRGPASVQYEESSAGFIELIVEEYEVQDTDPFAALALVAEGSRHIGDSISSFTSSGFLRAPAQLQLTTTEGKLIAANNISVRGHEIGGGEEVFRYSVLRAEFVSTSTQAANYYVIPLINYIAPFAHHWPDGDAHPLRLLPKGASDSELNARWTRGVTRYEYEGRPGFIQPLLDYQERVDELKAYRTSRVVTALMVGELPSGVSEAGDPLEWLPIDYLSLLCLVTGGDVGAPWVELRASDGELIRRIHVDLRPDPFNGQSFRLIRDDLHDGGTGLLLTEAPRSTYWQNPQLRTIMTYMIRSMGTGNIEDRYLDLARGVEGLSNLLGLRPATLLHVLGTPHRDEAKAVLQTAAKALQGLAKRALKAGLEPVHRIFQQIASRVVNAANQSSSFGELTVGVCQHFGFPDAQIMEQRFAQTPHPSATTWTGLLSLYRNRSAHGSYFDLSATPDEVRRIFKLSNHLLDILSRAVFSLLGYTGKYQPPVIVMSADEPLDWVSLNTDPAMFEYL